ncbi:hypothetical protein J437_LFUL011804 [Ladona fulva]|uniref:Dynein heavy chain linker domain-containing protein n=1 Tax=Ladona fulva TaxID=123851 RepID=A0A8K0P3G0_LADFU|nr:hypothetical protein J437_LFUL011804 [Ladona fulva]
MRELVESSITMFVSMFECLCYPTLACDDSFVWGPDLTLLAFKSKYQPIFSVDLKIDDSIGPNYSTEPDEFKVQLLQLFENAVIVSHGIPQVQPYLLTNLRFPDVLFLSSVGLAEENMAEKKQKMLCAIQSAIYPLKAYAREYKEFVSLYFATVEDYIKSFTTDNPSTTAMKEEAIRQRDYAKDLEERIPDELEIGPFLVLINNVKKVLLEKRWSFYKALLDYLAVKLNERVEEVCLEFKKIILRLNEKPISIEKLFEIKEWMETIPLSVKSQDDVLKIVLNEYEVLDFFYYNISDDDFNLKWEAIGFPHKITLQINETHAMHRNETERLEKLQLGDEIALMENFEQLTLRVHALSSPKLDLSKCEEVAIEVRRTWKQLQDCYETGKLLNHRQKLFGMPIKPYEAISDLKKEFEPYRNLWITASEWMKWHEIWMDNPLVHLESAIVEPTVMDLQETITKCIKIFSEIPAAQAVAIELKSQIEDFLPLIPMINALCNPGMRDRHWENFYKETGVKIVLSQTLTFNKCLELGIAKFYPHLQSLSEKASKEYSIESSLLNLEKNWESASFDINPYKDTGTYIVKISDEISQLLDDDTVIIQSLLFSQYKDAFEERLAEWEMNLKISQEVIEVWLDCQR